MLLPMLVLAFASAAPAARAPMTASAVRVPVQYVAGRIMAMPRTADGQVLRLWVDTGGGGGAGMYLLTDAAATRLKLSTSEVKLGGQAVQVTELPRFVPGMGVPPPAGAYAKAMLVPAAGLNGPGDATRYDGMLGAGYLPGSPDRPARIWTFDYPGQPMTLEAAGWTPAVAARAAPLGFPADAQGRRQSGFARIVVRVAGHPLNMLLDTGATGYPTPAAVTTEGGAATVRATSFITTSQFDRWHRAHPHWRVLHDADRLSIKGKKMRAIEVPAVEIAGWRTGPIWFTERPDTNFHDFMSSMMDRQVEGAVGGNLLQHFVMSVDYGKSTAWFRCVRGCAAAPAGGRPLSP
jgi:hypothetical protein